MCVFVNVYLSNDGDDDDGRQKSQRSVKENDFNKNMMAMPTKPAYFNKTGNDVNFCAFVRSYVAEFFFVFFSAYVAAIRNRCFFKIVAQ